MERIGMMMVAGLAAAVAHATDVTPGLAPRGTMPGEHVAHIYFNLATGERVATLIGGGIRPADNGVSPTVWVSDNPLPCSRFGQESGTVGVMDSPDCTTCLCSTATAVIYLDWGDINHDSVIDCVGVTWSTRATDTDADSDGVGDGIEGFAGTWTWYDGDDGFNSSGTRQALVGFTLVDLAGSVEELEPDVFATYTATVDLAGGAPDSSLRFEIGDTNGVDDSGTGNFNPGAGIDLDSDGYADFSYAFRYTLPGTYDFDNADGDSDTSTGVDGDPANAANNGWALVAGHGDVSFDGATYTPETSAPGDIGAEDAFDFFVDTNSDGQLEPIGTFWYGGFHCDIDGNGTYEIGANSNLWSQFRMVLYGPNACVCCWADTDGNGLLNFFDVETYIDWYNAGDLRNADFAFPLGVLNFFDIVTFLDVYSAGCP